MFKNVASNGYKNIAGTKKQKAVTVAKIAAERKKDNRTKNYSYTKKKIILMCN